MNQTKLLFPLIFISLEDEPWEPIEPNPNAAPAEEPDIEEQNLSQSDWTLASTEIVTHGAMCPAPVDWPRSTRSDIVGITTIPKQDFITCKVDPQPFS